MNKCKYHFKYIHTNFSEHHRKTYVLTYIISMNILGGRGRHWVPVQIKRPCLHVLGFRKQFISPMKTLGFYFFQQQDLVWFCGCYHLSSFEYECARRGLPTSFGVIIVFICLLHQSVMTIANYWTIDTQEPTNQPEWPCSCDDINVWCFFVMSFRH